MLSKMRKNEKKGWKLEKNLKKLKRKEENEKCKVKMTEKSWWPFFGVYQNGNGKG